MSDRFMKNFNGDKIFCLEYDKETLKDMVLNKQEEIERLNKENKELKKNIFEARKMIFDNYGVLDKYEIELLDDILKGE